MSFNIINEEARKAFLAQFEAIRELSGKAPCIFVGRCADYALSDDPMCCSIFVHAPIEFRFERVKKEINLKDDKKIMDYISRTDKKRANYYNYYSNKKWGVASTYDLCMNSSRLGEEGCVDLIMRFLNLESVR